MIPSEIVLCFDAGRNIGVAEIEVFPDGRGRWVESCLLRDVDDALALIDEKAHRVTLVAIESIIGYAHGSGAGNKAKAKTRDLIYASNVAGRLFGAAQVRKLDVEECSALEARRWLCGKPGCKDAVVKAMVKMRVKNLPDKTNSHIRDAIAAGLYLSMKKSWERRIAEAKRSRPIPAEEPPAATLTLGSLFVPKESP